MEIITALIITVVLLIGSILLSRKVDRNTQKSTVSFFLSFVIMAFQILSFFFLCFIVLKVITIFF
ncbi:hypothetical protein SAMN02746098_01261 [Desulfosporosinus lacus DSM 15449]|uniref:Uncharacterized protein n=1 Tax=Desulfosporosinus lacus DSM 15449 TaxID=1121420 RepID=A0A1M5VA80_9FIRM|nr:hypothetical protein SAMN02746098_01261 [Desulfosporosinus lacus DSM 15449]